MRISNNAIRPQNLLCASSAVKCQGRQQLSMAQQNGHRKLANGELKIDKEICMCVDQTLDKTSLVYTERRKKCYMGYFIAQTLWTVSDGIRSRSVLS